MDFIETKISDNFWCFEQNNVRCFLLKGEPYSLLIDACYSGDLIGLCKSKTDTPIMLILTHSDRDHIGCMDQFERRYMHPAEYSTMEAKNNIKADALPLWEGDSFDIGTFRFEVIHLPGHTPGSIALLEREKRFMISGDSVQTGPIYMFGFERNVAAYKHSMARLLQMRDSFDICYSSHNQLVVPSPVIEELYSFAGEVCRGVLPPALPLPVPAPPSVPENIRLYIKGNAQFYLPFREH